MLRTLTHCSQLHGVLKATVLACMGSVLQVNPRYVPQLQTVLTWPHSVGIVGGRPSSSLYFVGFQGDNVLFLDPHETQQVVLPKFATCLWTGPRCGSLNAWSTTQSCT
jgi:Peptidase family C54